MKPGVYQATKKDGTVYYRGNITYSGKHISIGSFPTETKCNKAYNEAWNILKNDDITILNIMISIDDSFSLA